MKSVVTWTLLASLAGAVAAAEAPAPTAHEILERNLDALGGRAKFRAVHSLRLSATQSIPGAPGKEVALRVLWKRPDRLRIEVPEEGLLHVEAFDGSVAWSSYPELPGFETEILEGEARDLLKEQADLLEGPTFDPETKGHHVELVGREELPGGPAWRILLTMASGELRTLWFDCETNLQVREERTARVGDREVVTVSILSDFRSVGGLLFAHRTESRQRETGGPADGSGEPSIFAIQGLELDVDLPDSLFAPPASDPLPPPALAAPADLGLR